MRCYFDVRTWTAVTVEACSTAECKVILTPTSEPVEKIFWRIKGKAETADEQGNKKTIEASITLREDGLVVKPFEPKPDPEGISISKKKDPSKWMLLKWNESPFGDVFQVDITEVEETSGKNKGKKKQMRKPSKYPDQITTQVDFSFQRLGMKDYGRIGCFAGTIMGIILVPLPLGATAFFGLMVALLSYVVTFKEAFAGFVNGVPWLIVVAYCLAIPFVESGLGKRISLLVVGLLGKTTIGLVYALGLTDTMMGIGIPSITARAGGIILPIVRELCEVAGSSPAEGTTELFGEYMHIALYHMGVVNAALFNTAVASNILVIDQAAGLDEPVEMSFGSWFVAASVPCLLLIATIPVIVFFIWKPKMTKFPDSKGFAARGLEELGPMKRSEKITIIAFAITIFLWLLEGVLDQIIEKDPITGEKPYKMNSVASGLVGLMILLCSGTLTWKRCLAEAAAWNTAIWFAVLISLAQSLKVPFFHFQI